MYDLGLESGDPTERKYWLGEAAEKGYAPAAMFSLGLGMRATRRNEGDGFEGSCRGRDRAAMYHLGLESETLETRNTVADEGRR